MDFEKEYEGVIEFESKVRFFGDLINEKETDKIFENEAKSIYYGYGIKYDYVSTYIENIIEDVPRDCYDRDAVISDICDRWQEFLKEFSRQNFPPELEKVLDILKQIGYDDFEIEWFFRSVDETKIDEYALEELLNALYKARILTMELVDFILSVRKCLLEKKHLTYSER